MGAAFAAALITLLVAASSAFATPPPEVPGGLPAVSDGGPSSPGVNPLLRGFSFGGAAQHGTATGHLPAVQDDVELISKLELTAPFGDVAPEQIADVAVHKGAAYLASWAVPINPATQTCERGGFFSVDISDPARPRQLAFRPALADNYHGEGMHVITFPNGRDILAVNNETCLQTTGTPARGGGFDLYDVTNPADPVALVRAAGDHSDPALNTASLICCTPTAQGAATPIAHTYHSVFMWRDGNRVFLVGTDNDEQASFDVDIFDITNPAAPTAVAEFDLDEAFPQIVEPQMPAEVFLHDMVVKEIRGIQTMLLSYWDGGYVLLNVENPAAPQYIGDSSFGTRDPLTNAEPPEGNGHQAEFSHDNRFILAADEDFGPYRFLGEITAGPNAGFTFPNAGIPDEGPIPTPEAPIGGDTHFVGDACDPATIPAPPAGVTIALIERGTCFFQEKTENVEAAGYGAAVIFNNVTGDPGCEALINMDFTNYTGNIATLFVGRSVGFRLMDAYDPATYACTPGDVAASTPTPAAPRAGSPLNLGFLFDGWGYAHLFRNGSGKLAEVGRPYAIPQSLDTRFATDFGELSIHEWAADATENIAYSSYYTGGLRVATFGDAGLQEVGAFIDAGGSNFWGVEQFTASEEYFRAFQEQRLIAASDRDFGLYLFRYTGPGAAAPPACSNGAVEVGYRASVTVPLGCTDPNGNALTRTVTTAPANGSVSAVNQAAGTVTYRHTGSSLGPAGTLRFRASDGAARSNVASVALVAVPRDGGRCFNPFRGGSGADTLNGSQFGDDIRGGGGNDSVRGFAGADCVLGEAGNDRVIGDDGDDVVDGGDGRDALFGGAARDTVSGGDGNDDARGDAGNDRLSMQDGNDDARAGSGSDVVGGGGGTDDVRGDSGRDTVSGNGGGDQVHGGSANDRAFGGSGDDRVYGGSGNDRVFGGSGDDRLTGGAGSNRISAGSGDDDVRAVNRRRDTIACGRGTDRVRADANDRVARDCERVTRVRRRSS